MWQMNFFENKKRKSYNRGEAKEET